MGTYLCTVRPGDDVVVTKVCNVRASGGYCGWWCTVMKVSDGAGVVLVNVL